MSDNEQSASRDFDKPSKEIALEQIYEATGYKVPASKITLYAASVLDQFPEVFTDENTFAPADIDPLEDARFNGENGFIYRRLDLREIIPSVGINNVPIEYPFKVWDALPLLNSLLGTQLDTTDLENDEFTDPLVPVTLRAAEGSLAWIGTKVVNPIGPGQFLIPNPFLPGFVEYTPPVAPAV